MTSPADRPLRIAVIGHLRHPIAAPFMGGMESHCDLLVRALVTAGHRPTLFASGDSAGDLPLHAIAPVAYEAELPWARWHGTPELAAWLGDAYAQGWEAIRRGGFDVVHNNAMFPALLDWALADRVPMVTSLHVPPFPALADAVRRADAPCLRFTATSASHLAGWRDLAPGRIAAAWNGVDLDRWRYAADAGSRAIWSGRITPNKGTVEALEAATAAGIGLDVAGPVDCPKYFEWVRAVMTGPHRYLGHLSNEALAVATGRAAVAICTPIWDEPFGLVAAEALACGTPVAALDRGALGEVVGPCGGLAADPAGLPDAIHRAIVVPRVACRARAEALFGADAMVRRYAASYAAARSSIASTVAELA